MTSNISRHQPQSITKQQMINIMSVCLHSLIWYDVIWYDIYIWYDTWYDIFVNCKWVFTRWQLYNTQNNTKQTIHRTTQNKQYTEQHKTNNTQNNTKQTIHGTTQNFCEQHNNFNIQSLLRNDARRRTHSRNDLRNRHVLWPRWKDNFEVDLV